MDFIDILPTKVAKYTVLKNMFTRWICPMPNLGSSCWLNSLLQALSNTDMVYSLLETEYPQHMGYVNKLLFIWRQMKLNAPQPIQQNLLKGFLMPNSFNTIPSQFTDGTQQDAHDFFVQVVAPMNGLANYITGGQIERICLSCRNEQISKVADVSILLKLQNYRPSVQQLLEQFCQLEDGPDNFWCKNCKKRTKIQFKTKITTPQKRFS